MSFLDLATADEPRAGTLAAWFLSFHAAEPGGVAPAATPAKVFGFDRYHAEIAAALPDGLGGGSFSITIEGITDEDYALIRRGDRALPFARLFLGWADTNASVSGYVASTLGLAGTLAGVGDRPPPDDLLVAVLAVDAVTRRAGSRRYEAVVTGRDWLFTHLRRQRTNRRPAGGADIPAALHSLLEGAARLRRDRDYRIHPLARDPAAPPPVAPDAPPAVDLPGDSAVADVLAAQEHVMAVATARAGRGLLLLRDGVLHLGVRPIPLAGTLRRLTVRGGLVEAVPIEPVHANPGAPPDEERPRRQFRLTLRGRPDLKPGDLVAFDAPAGDAAATDGGALRAIRDLAAGPLIPDVDGAFADPITLYVASVEHRLGRTTSFVTTLTGVEVAPGREWDPPPAGTRAEPTPRARHADQAIGVAQLIRDAVRAELAARAGVEVAEVRALVERGVGEPPGQTETLWRGFDAVSAHGRNARLGRVRRPSVSPIGGAPYVTPFAFGKCGLVLPRYPGTRVAVVHREGQSDDPVDVGALWESGSAPDGSLAGDWWLSLPSAVEPARRARVEDGETVPPYAGKVTQDLIDADGNRVIEVGELTIRVGRDVLRDAGERPPRGDAAGAITIEHADGGARLVLHPDGSIVLKGTSIELDAGGGRITLKASQVDVQ